MLFSRTAPKESLVVKGAQPVLSRTLDGGWELLAMAAAVILGSSFFCCLSITIAGLVLTHDRLMGIGQAITMPLFFASNALYPLDVMPQAVCCGFSAQPPGLSAEQ